MKYKHVVFFLIICVSFIKNTAFCEVSDSNNSKRDIEMERAISALETAEENFCQKEFENAQWNYFVAGCLLSEAKTRNKKLEMRIDLGKLFNEALLQNDPKFITDNIIYIIDNIHKQ